MRLFLATILIALLMLFAGYEVQASDYLTYTIERGDTPATIASDILKDTRMFPLLMRYNGITNPDMLLVGKDLKIPYSISKKRVARVSFSQGEVRGSHGNDNFEALNQGDILLENHRIETRNGRVEIVLDEGSIIRIGPNTRFVLDQYNYSETNRNTNVNLQNGFVNMQVTRLTQGSTYNLSTLTAVAGVRGTFFYVNFDESTNQTGIAVYSGHVFVKNNQAEAYVDAGYATITYPDGELEVPFPIPGRIKWLDE